jgi:peptidoglycan/xylan/chitin deacetylase (PgdA/CDA1 family)
MLESKYVHSPAGLADYIVGAARPGTILLAHDTGPDDRLVAIRNLPRMITGLRREGFELVTASDLLAAGGEKLLEPSAGVTSAGPDLAALGAPR